MKNSNSEGELQADSIAGGGAFESSNNIRNDEEPLEVDGGLGSSVCGEDLVHGSNLADAVMTNQPEIGMLLSLILPYDTPSSD